ncbi:MAG: SRPBCC family protein [Candidatus Saccharibacteria bacterium]
MKIVLPITINQPITTVFDQVADARNEAKWNSTLTDYQLVGQGPVGQGSVFTYKNRGNEFTSTLVTYNKPNSLVFDIHGKPMDIHASVTFEAAANVTKLVAEYNLMPKGGMKVMMLIFRPFLSKVFAKEFENFKKFSEAQVE